MPAAEVTVAGAGRSVAPAAAPGPALGSVAVCASSLLAMSAAQADTAPADQAGADDDERKLQQVTVTGVRPLLHDKLPQDLQDLQDTPQSITVVTGQLMGEQAVTRLEDALQNVPGSTLNAGKGAARGDTVNLRGFSAFNDFLLDGIRDAAVHSRDSFDLQSVAVVKEPSAVLFGRSSTGGAIHQVGKAPRTRPGGRFGGLVLADGAMRQCANQARYRRGTFCGARSATGSGSPTGRGAVKWRHGRRRRRRLQKERSSNEPTLR